MGFKVDAKCKAGYLAPFRAHAKKSKAQYLPRRQKAEIAMRRELALTPETRRLKRAMVKAVVMWLWMSIAAGLWQIGRLWAGRGRD